MRKKYIFMVLILIFAFVLINSNNNINVISGLTIPKGFENKEVVSKFDGKDGISYTKYFYKSIILDEIDEDFINSKNDRVDLKRSDNVEFLSSKLKRFTSYTFKEQEIIDNLSKEIIDTDKYDVYVYEDNSLIKLYIFQRDKNVIHIVIIHR